MKQTAVEWLYKNLLENPISNQDLAYNEGVFHNAKEMEKQQGYSEEEMLNFAWFLLRNVGQYSDDRIAHFEGKYLEQFKKK